jgi:hypothetical protein
MSSFALQIKDPPNDARIYVWNNAGKTQLYDGLISFIPVTTH